MFVPRSLHRAHLHSAQVTRPHGLLLSLLLALVIGGSAWASAQRHAPQGNCTHPDPAIWPDCPDAIAFLAKFQSALKSNNREAVAMLVNYPLLVTGAAGKTHVRSRAQLLASFNGIFTAAVRNAILKATPDDVWGNYQGFMIGDGVIWFDGILPKDQASRPPDPDAKYPFKVITVNRASP
jgi:hypothetical protein